MTKNFLGYTLGEFFTNSSGHSAGRQPTIRKDIIVYGCHQNHPFPIKPETEQG
jgi:hypothetical protein